MSRPTLLVANALLASASCGFAVAAAVRPTLLSRSPRPPSTGETFYSLMYATRGVPLGLLAAVAPWACPGRAAALALIAAAGAQAGDAAIGAARSDRRMIVGAGAVGALHLITASVVW